MEELLLARRTAYTDSVRIARRTAALATIQESAPYRAWASRPREVEL
jgi:hypothetical protein